MTRGARCGDDLPGLARNYREVIIWDRSEILTMRQHFYQVLLHSGDDLPVEGGDELEVVVVVDHVQLVPGLMRGMECKPGPG